MEEEKAAAYYDELTRKGGGAARFKQGLGFSSAGGAPPARVSALPSSSSGSFLSGFVKASSPTRTQELEKEAQLQNIQNKLKKKEPPSIQRPFKERERERDGVLERERDRERSSRRRSRSRSRERERDRKRERSSRRSRSGSREGERGRKREGSRRWHRSSSRERKRDRERGRRRSRSLSDEERDSRRRKRSRSRSPRDRRVAKGRGERGREGKGVKKEGNGAVDYASLIDGYDKMTAAERVKAKMKLQLSQTVKTDATMGSGSRWERFDFDKDAPLDDEEIEAADDDAVLVKHIGQSFRFSNLEAKREEELKAAHEEAMFGAPAPPPPSHTSESEPESENEKRETNDNDPASTLINEKVFAKQQGSWRDRARRNGG